MFQRGGNSANKCNQANTCISSFLLKYGDLQLSNDKVLQPFITNRHCVLFYSFVGQILVRIKMQINYNSPNFVLYNDILRSQKSKFLDSFDERTDWKNNGSSIVIEIVKALFTYVKYVQKNFLRRAEWAQDLIDFFRAQLCNYQRKFNIWHSGCTAI